MKRLKVDVWGILEHDVTQVCFDLKRIPQVNFVLDEWQDHLVFLSRVNPHDFSSFNEYLKSYETF